MTLIRDQVRMTLHHDGKDHINISSYGKTEIAPSLNSDYRRRFVVPHLGEFGGARCFANWMASGGNDHLRLSHDRYNSDNVPRERFITYLLYGKYYQVLSMREHFAKFTHMFDLPWVSYKQYVSGVREYARWESYNEIIRAMVRHVVEHPNRPFKWSIVHPEALDIIQDQITEIALAQGTALEDIVDIRKADEVARKLNEERNKAREQRDVHRRQGAKFVDQGSGGKAPSKTTGLAQEPDTKDASQIQQDAAQEFTPETQVSVQPLPLSIPQEEALQEAAPLVQEEAGEASTV